jgi:hypothetical protein
LIALLLGKPTKLMILKSLAWLTGITGNHWILNFQNFTCCRFVQLACALCGYFECRTQRRHHIESSCNQGLRAPFSHYQIRFIHEPSFIHNASRSLGATIHVIQYLYQITFCIQLYFQFSLSNECALKFFSFFICVLNLICELCDF